MPSTTNADCRDRSRNLLFMATPSLWSHWPYLPLMRRNPCKEEEYGVLCDLLGWKGTPGFSATVFLSNLFFLPASLDDFLTLPREVFDTPEEIYAAGWRVD
jgi:hypothetical protein